MQEALGLAVALATVAVLWDVRRRVLEALSDTLAAERQLRRDQAEGFAAERQEAKRRIQDLEAKLLARSPQEYRGWTPPAEKARDKKEPEPLGENERLDPIFGRVKVEPLFNAKGAVRG